MFHRARRVVHLAGAVLAHHARRDRIYKNYVCLWILPPRLLDDAVEVPPDALGGLPAVVRRELDAKELGVLRQRVMPEAEDPKSVNWWW